MVMDPLTGQMVKTYAGLDCETYGLRRKKPSDPPGCLDYYAWLHPELATDQSADFDPTDMVFYIDPAERLGSADGAFGGGPFVVEICARLESAARANDIPEAFFARLIWTESHFNPDAVSPKGAQGIAQFMPDTARMRGLEDPFDAPSAIKESARFLADLRDEFGNLGLAAAAYNAGGGRVQAWQGGRSRLPLETRNYVQTVTGVAANNWIKKDMQPAIQDLDPKRSFQTACRALPTRAVTQQTLAG
jgi:hypothetical protein